MSEFKVEVRTLSSVREHTNAHSLELGKVKGLEFQFVIEKGVYKEGDLVVYFPIDSVLPSGLITHLGIENFLAGKDKNRIKTVKLRKEISQGFVCPWKDLTYWIRHTVKENDDVTKDLGVTKYEPPVVMSNDGRLEPLPDGVPIYDIEGADRYNEVIQTLLESGARVYITEKIEGTNFSVTVSATRSAFKEDHQVFVNSRNKTIIELDLPLPKLGLWTRVKNYLSRAPKRIPKKKSNPYWQAARKQNIISLAKILLVALKVTQVTIRGEMTGPSIQNNIYDLKEHKIYIFDILVDGHYVDGETFKSLTIGYDVVPVLAWNVKLEDWLNGKTMQEISNGKSVLAKIKREGIVVKPMVEDRHPKIGRLIIKQRSPEYLAKEKD